jgi:endogenous inhibitor of DNA gyrase (YacG/DUF329 family)
MPGQGPSEWPQWPFCSDRCRLIDLGRWLNEEYRLATDTDEELPPEEGDTNLPP